MSQETHDDIAAIIKERSDLFEQNFASGDTAALVQDYYVSNDQKPVASAGSGAAIVGHGDLQALFAALVKDFSSVRQAPHFIRVDGNLAYEISNSYLTPSAGGAEVEFRYVAVWRRCSDTWRVEADFFAPGPL